MEVVAWLAACAAGLGAGAVAARVLARKSAEYDENLAGENEDHVLKAAERRRQLIIEEGVRAAREQYEAEAKRREEEREVARQIHVDFDAELENRQKELDAQQSEVDKLANSLRDRQNKANAIRQQTEQTLAEAEGVREELKDSLAQRCSLKKDEFTDQMREEAVSAERLGITRWLMDNQSELKAESRRLAKETLSVVLDRYSPTFIWPKTSFAVQLPNKDLAQRHFGDGSELLKLLLEGTETGAELGFDSEENPTIRISGGAGVDKEVIRLTLEDLVARNSLHQPDRARTLLKKYREQIDQFVLKLGEAAVSSLGLPPLHPEIAKLIGSLNYRTSHRQNQYFHSIEVARLAGMIADEVGVDHVLAKRAGILHDIGKALDYRIEGSHAVISGDYATRYGEAEDVVDTVLSHHDDKIVETAHAYILKSADALSGARPGARVDMEEGYQKRIESIVAVVNSFQRAGVKDTNIMHAGREIHVFVDQRRVREHQIEKLAKDIARKLESDCEFPGQIKVTVVRRLEVSEVA